MEAQNEALKRQLTVIEQEASVFRGHTKTLEQENQKLLAEIKSLQNQIKNPPKTSLLSSNDAKENAKLKTTIESLEKEKSELNARIKKILEDPTDKLPPRTRKPFSDAMTKPQLKVTKILIKSFLKAFTKSSLKAFNKILFSNFRKKNFKSFVKKLFLNFY